MAKTLLDIYKEAEEGARLSNLSRMKQASTIYEDIIKRYEPGGAFGAGYESLLERQKTRDVGATAQRDISRGLYGIRPYEAEWEATTGAPARLKLEDIRMERLSQSQQGLASFLTDINEPYPDYGALTQAYQSQAAAPSGGGGAGGFTTGGAGSAGRGGGLPTYGAFGSIAPTGGGGGGGTTPFQRNLGAYAEREKRSQAAAETRAGTVYQKGEVPQDALSKQVIQGRSAQEPADEPPSWGGNYHKWKAKMDAYNKAHGKPLTGY